MSALNISHGGFNAVSRTKRPTEPGRISQHESDGWYIYSNISNRQKIDGGFVALCATRPFPLAAGPLQMFFNCSIFDGNQCSNLDGSGQEKDLKLWEFFFENIVQLPNFGS